MSISRQMLEQSFFRWAIFAIGVFFSLVQNQRLIYYGEDLSHCNSKEINISKQKMHHKIGIVENGVNDGSALAFKRQRQ